MLDKIVAATEAKEKKQDQYLGHCPAHNDRNPSLSICLKDNNILLKCHAGCSQDAVIDTLKAKGCWKSDSRQKRVESSRTEYLYEGPKYKEKVLRIDFSDHTKTFRRFHSKDGRWIHGAAPEPPFPYKYSTWKDSEEVILVEGEKCADSLLTHGFKVTCVPGGANGWKDDYVKPFKGKRVIIVPDNDSPGRKFATTVGLALLETSDVKILELPDLKEKQDIYDWLALGNTKEDLKEILAKDSLPFKEWANRSSKRTSFKRLSEVEAKKAEWFWANRVPLSGVTLLEGDGGIGKSYITADIVARATTGRALPGDISRPPISVLLLSVEDDPEVVLKPRYDGQGADCSKVLFQDETFHLTKDNLAILDKEITSSNAKLVVIDPIIAYFPKGDTNKSKDVRDFISGLHELAKKHKIAVIAIRHWNKNSHGKASQRGVGSVDFRNASRSVLQVIKTEEKAFLALEKSNYAAQAKSLTFSIENSKLQWGEESDLSAEEILKMANQAADTDKSALEEAIEFISDALEYGPISAKELNAKAKGEGISSQTLRRARESLGLKAMKINGITGRGYMMPKKEEVVQVVQDSCTQKHEQDEQEVVQIENNGHRSPKNLFKSDYQKVVL